MRVTLYVIHLYYFAPEERLLQQQLSSSNEQHVVFLFSMFDVLTAKKISFYAVLRTTYWYSPVSARRHFSRAKDFTIYSVTSDAATLSS